MLKCCCWLVAGFLLIQTPAVSAAETLIRQAMLIDGSGARGYLADVRIAGDRIVEIRGQLESGPDDMVIDGRGLVLSPGFIDTHSHHDYQAAAQPEMLAAVSQGITTIVVGVDGGSALPLAGYFAQLEQSPLAVNVASYSGHNTLREAVMGDDFRRPATASERDAMGALLAADLDAGALGLSTGLEYDPGIYSETSEVIALAQLVGERGGRYDSHLRSEDRFFWEALDELLVIGEAAGIPVHIAHIKLAAKSLWGRAIAVRQRLTAARARGIDVSADIYPYEYWASTMSVLLPERDFTDRRAVEFALAELAPPETIYLVNYLPDPALEGMTVSAIAAAAGEDPVSTYSRLLVTAQEYEQENPDAEAVEMIVAASMTESDIAALMDWEFTNICSDGSHDGHPRGWGSYPRVLGHYVRDQEYLELPRAIRKMTALAAANVGLPDRGTLTAGGVADLVLFDPLTIRDTATIADPARKAEGIVAVWTNGVLVYQQGKATGSRPGRVLRRAPFGN